jgi:bacterioferritin
MKGNAKIIDKLNSLLADELLAINQYMMHAEMCSNWGYVRLHKMVQDRAIAEMRHAEKLMERILFLEGSPIIKPPLNIKVGANVEDQQKNDHAAELVAIKGYNEGIRLAVEIGDNGSREMLGSILKQEEDHIDVIEIQLDQIKKIGIQNYLLKQID